MKYSPSPLDGKVVDVVATCSSLSFVFFLKKPKRVFWAARFIAKPNFINKKIQFDALATTKNQTIIEITIEINKIMTDAKYQTSNCAKLKLLSSYHNSI